ncbi:AAA family ATPase [Peribacillus sp. SCS-26]|uniref:AAA family ATPase n=1 Tax=Paraperibacillus marinus TaxID=3115295 RepID=UPI003905CC73
MEAFIRKMIINHNRIPSYSEYPFSLPSVKEMKEISFHPSVTYFVGENGRGKSTLLEALAVAAGFNPEGGSLNFNFSTYDSHSVLSEYVRLVRGVFRAEDAFFLRAESFYNAATYIEEVGREEFGGNIHDSYGGKSLHEQSHGEAFFSTFNARFRGNGLYILDEPEAALSPLRQLSMLSRIHALVKSGSQFIIATHSPILMSYPDSVILEFSDDGLTQRSLRETEHFKLMKQFFDDPDRMLHHLLKP